MCNIMQMCYCFGFVMFFFLLDFHSYLSTEINAGLHALN